MPSYYTNCFRSDSVFQYFSALNSCCEWVERVHALYALECYELHRALTRIMNTWLTSLEQNADSNQHHNPEQSYLFDALAASAVECSLPWWHHRCVFQHGQRCGQSNAEPCGFVPLASREENRAAPNYPGRSHSSCERELVSRNAPSCLIPSVR